MKNMFLLAIVASPALAMAQEGEYTLDGKIGALNAPARVYLIKRAPKSMTVDSTEIKNGVFIFKGTVANVTSATLLVDHKGVGLNGSKGIIDSKSIYLEKGVIKVSAKDSVKNAVVAGSVINKEAPKYNKALEVPEKAMTELLKEYSMAPAEKQKDEEYIKSLRERSAKIVSEKQVLQKKYIAENPNSYFSLEALKEIAGANPNLAVVSPLFKGLSEDLRNSTEGKKLAQLLEGQRQTVIGAMAPEFIQNDVNDKPVKLSDFRGKYVLLDFWASWCGPCRKENPNVVKAYNTYKDKNFTVLGISLDQPNAREKWLNAIKEDNLTWTQVSDLKYWDNEVAKMYAVRAIPQNFLVDPSGKIVGKNLRGEELEKKLAEVIK